MNCRTFSKKIRMWGKSHHTMDATELERFHVAGTTTRSDISCCHASKIPSVVCYYRPLWRAHTTQWRTRSVLNRFHVLGTTDRSVYVAASKHILQKLDPIHHQGLRIALGAFCTSPLSSLHAKAQEMSWETDGEKNVLIILPIAVFLNHLTQNA